MAKSSWVVNPEPPYNLIPKHEYQRPVKAGYHIMPDMPDFVSPIDGKIVRGRKGYRNHCKEHKVTNSSDYTEQWKQQTKERQQIHSNKQAKAERIEALKYAYEKHTRR